MFSFCIAFSSFPSLLLLLAVSTISSSMVLQPRELSNTTLAVGNDQNQMVVRCSTGAIRVHDLYSYKFCEEPAYAIAHRRSGSRWRYIGNEVIDLASLQTEMYWKSAHGECSFTWTLQHDQEYIGPPLPIKRGALGAAAVQMIAQCRRGWQYGTREGEVQVTPRIQRSGMMKAHSASILQLHVAERESFLSTTNGTTGIATA